MSRNWIWLDPKVLLAVHEEQWAEHGGAAGTRDEAGFARWLRGHIQPR